MVLEMSDYRMRTLSLARRWRVYALGLVTTALLVTFALAEFATEKYISDRSRVAGTIEVTIVVMLALAYRPVHRPIEQLVEAPYVRWHSGREIVYC